MKTKHILILILVTLLAWTLASCGGQQAEAPAAPAEATVAEAPTATPVPPTPTPKPPTPTPVPPTPTPEPPTPTPVPPTPTPEPENLVLTAAQAYYSGGLKFIKAEDLYANLNDGDPDNDPFIISVRAPEDYAKGHIPGAINVSIKQLFDPDFLATLPEDKEIVVVCYTGQTASWATAALNMAGYDAYTLLFGMSSWTNDPEVFVKRFNPEKHANDFPVEKETNPWPEETYDLPDPAGDTPADAAYAVLKDGPRYIQAPALYENLNDGDPDNDPIIISVRAKEDYEKGHIPGAVWASPKELFTEEMLSKLDPDREIVVVCYTGQAASHVAVGLNELGYDAKVLLFGMSSWTTDPEVFVKRFNPEKHAHDYPVEKGAAAMGGENPILPAVQEAMSDGLDFVKAEDLYANLNDGDPDNDPFILSVRAPEDYAKGHIKGAVNVSVTKLFDPDFLATLPEDKEIVVVCYTGQTASQAASALEIAGYDAKVLLFGMSSWTTDPEVFVKRFNPEKHAHDYPTTTEPGTWGDETYDLPEPPASDPVAAAAAWLGDGPNYIKADALYENLNDGDPDNDPLIISVRAKEDYEKGHIPGAVWASPKELFTEEMLRKIDPDRPIVTVCYTGQAAGWVAAALNDLGYDASALLFGMSSWTNNPEVFVKRFNPEKHAHDYPVEK
ncbi:MAG TPA: rhodanese-like domain-containing protein [Anaerolineae bacterium]|nr:rhodanese-like domain-containing protein [Anaerolineae bacterium]